MLAYRGKQLAAVAAPLTGINIFQEAITQIYSGKTIDFDEHRNYVIGDDPRDIDWKATARSGTPLIKKFIPHEEHLLVLIADTGCDMLAAAPSGEIKKNIAADTLCVAALIAKAFHFQFSFCRVNTSGSEYVPLGRSDDHIERILKSLDYASIGKDDTSDSVQLLRYAMSTTQRRAVFFIATEEPVPSAQLLETIRLVKAKHYIIWAIIEDADLLSPTGDLPDGYDVRTKKTLHRKGIYHPKLYRTYIEAEHKRKTEVDKFFTQAQVRAFRINGSQDIITQLQKLCRSME